MPLLAVLWLAAGTRPATAQQTFLVLVSGLAGEPSFATSYADWTGRLRSAATTRLGIPAANIRVLSESAGGAARSTRDNVLAALVAVGARAGRDDEVVLVLFGHGAEAGGDARLNLPGPDLTAGELAAALGSIRAHRIVVVNTTSASGAFLKPLAAPGRIILTATRSGGEQNETLFPGFFVDALAGDGADTDKNGRVSVLEAFDYARREVQRVYDSGQRLQTEHALLDADGDGSGTAEPVAGSGDGAAAALAYFGPGAAAAAIATTASPALKSLLQEKARLEAELDALRGRKSSMPDADYQRELERLLLEVSRNGQAIRKLQGGAQ